MDYQKIYEALRTIKEVCDNNTEFDCCQKCPLGKADGTCYVTRREPDKWKLKKPDPTIRLME